MTTKLAKSVHRWTRWAVIAWAAALPISQAGAQAVDTPAADNAPAMGATERARIVAQIASVGRRGFLYEVAKPGVDGSIGKRLFLYGTIHVGRPGSEPFNTPLMAALSRSRRLALEADPTDTAAAQRIVQKLGQYDADDALSHHVTPALLARVTAFGEKSGVPADRIERLKPWLLANMVTVRQIGGTGLDADLGSELYLAGFAQGVHLPIVEVEGIEAQLQMFASLPDGMQAAALVEALDEADLDEAHNETLAMFDLWLRGDVAAGGAMVADLHREAEGKVFERYFVDTLIDQRNQAMVDRAENYLERPGNTFFAVGALHLFGDRGLVRTFEQRGYRVVDLQGAVAPQ